MLTTNAYIPVPKVKAKLLLAQSDVLILRTTIYKDEIKYLCTNLKAGNFEFYIEKVSEKGSKNHYVNFEDKNMQMYQVGENQIKYKLVVDNLTFDVEFYSQNFVEK